MATIARFGGAGDDMIDLGFGNDYAEGGAGNDILKGDESDDILFGGDGSDVLNGDDLSRDSRYAGGNDWMMGGAEDGIFFLDMKDNLVDGIRPERDFTAGEDWLFIWPKTFNGPGYHGRFTDYPSAGSQHSVFHANAYVSRTSTLRINPLARQWVVLRDTSIEDFTLDAFCVPTGLAALGDGRDGERTIVLA